MPEHRPPRYRGPSLTDITAQQAERRRREQELLGLVPAIDTPPAPSAGAWESLSDLMQTYDAEINARAAEYATAGPLPYRVWERSLPRSRYIPVSNTWSFEPNQPVRSIPFNSMFGVVPTGETAMPTEDTPVPVPGTYTPARLGSSQCSRIREGYSTTYLVYGYEHTIHSVEQFRECCQFNGIVLPEANDPQQCPHCGGWFEPSFGGATSAEFADQASGRPVCYYCKSRYYVPDMYNNGLLLPRQDNRHPPASASDTGQWTTHRMARENWVFSAAFGGWFEHAENIRSDDEFEGGDPNVDEEGRYDYDTDIFAVLSWPSVSGKHDPVYGVELEMEQRDRDDSISGITRALKASDGISQTNQFILKYDGSLHEGGVEIVTLPYPLDYHQNKFGWEGILSDKLRRLAISGIETRSCGMHVHINKAALTPLQIGKMLVFVNSPNLNRHMTVIAQRESGNYCERSRKSIKDGKSRSNSRYDVLNVGDKTVEVRMFRGNLRPERVLKNIEFCDALVHYCKDASMARLEDWDTFSAWLIKNRGRYPQLVRYLHDKGVDCFTHLRFGKPGSEPIPDAA